VQQKKLNLISVEYYTKSVVDEERVTATRKNKGRPVFFDRKGDGEGFYLSGGSGTKNWGPKVQHQQSDEKKRICEHRVSFEDGSELGPRSRIKSTAKADIEEAA
jgi:hypothetical protein